MAMSKVFRKRTEMIRSRLDRLKLYDPENIFDFIARESGFNKIYLSTAVGYCGSGYRKEIETVAERLPVGGLVYFANNCQVRVVTSNDYGQKKDKPPLLPDWRRTFRARFYNYVSAWDPAVYRKIK